MSMKRLMIVLLGIFFSQAFAQNETGLLRFPSTNGKDVCFMYAGDLYTVPISGGVARKLTNDEVGMEMFPHYSPDGSKIAFTGQYDGNTEVYVIPAQGGVPQRLTYTATLNRDDVTDRMGPNNIVMTWEDNQTVVYRSRRKSFNSFKGQLFKTNLEGTIDEEMPFSAAGWCSYSGDGKKMALNRVFRTFRTWKYYEGGMAPEVWIYDFNSKKSENITKNKAQDIFPMWHKDKVYFLSDRDKIMNLFSYDLNSKEVKKLTNFDKYDIKFPTLGGGKIIFENGGFLHVFDTETEQTSKINVQILDDFNASRKLWVDASKYIDAVDISHDGKRLVFGARGDIFSVPASKGITYNFTKSSGVHDRVPTWSPDGKYIAYISDKTGEDEIYLMAKDGKGKPIQITKNADTYKYGLLWSPDAKKIAWSDKMNRLNYVNIESGKVTVVDKADTWEIRSFSWSPDSKWVTYSRPETESESKIYLYNLANQKKTAVTEGWYGSSSPVFSADGKYLVFTSNRDFNPTYSWTEWNHSYTNMEGIYLVTLAKDTKSPFELQNDVVTENKTESKDDKKEEKSDEKKSEESKDIVIDLDNIQNRIVKFPFGAGSYYGMDFTDGGMYFMGKTASENSFSMKYYDFESRETETIGDFSWFQISANKKKVMINNHGKYYVLDVPKRKLSLSESVDLSNMDVLVDKKEEWKQIFNEAWRQMKYFFYDPNMHGVNWVAMKEKYEPLLKYMNHRADLTYIIGEMIGELNVGHAYVGGGDLPKPKKIQTGLLGADIKKVMPSGYFQIKKILKGQNWTEEIRSPLTEIGVDAKEGEYIIAIDGVPAFNYKFIGEALQNKAGKQVMLTINSKPSEEGARNVIVKPLSDVSKLEYFNWVSNNIEKVNKQSNGKIGYLHVPNMGVEGLNEFAKYFYPQVTKQALIIDDRGNGGGNVSPMLIERLSRKMVIAGMFRNGKPNPSPREIHIGPKVVLIDQYSASDGDLFPYRFKAMKLGKVIGVRSWGGVVGIRGSLPFIDGGTLTKPEFAHFDPYTGKWIIEGYGVDPDIEVVNDIAKEYEDNDEQLNKAIEVLLQQLKEKPNTKMKIPEFPNKSK